MIYVWCIIKILFVNVPVWLFKHRIVMVVIAVAIGGIYAYSACNRPKTVPNQIQPTQQLTEEQRKAPTIQQAPYILQTYSRKYYLVKFEQPNEDLVILYQWYEWGKNKWFLQNSDVGVPFDRNVQGDFKLDKR